MTEGTGLDMAAERMANALSETERYRLLVEAIADYAIFMLDPEGHVVSWNPGARRFTGYETSEIIGKYFGHFHTEAERAAGQPERGLEEARTVGRFESEGWRLRKDGSRFWAHEIIEAIRSPSGDILGFAKITQDHTEKHAQDEALLKSEQQFRILVQGVTDYALYMIDEEGNVSSWNAGAERIKGYRPDEIIGQHFSTFYTEEDRRDGLPKRALETAAREGRYEREGWRVRKDGSRFWANVVIDAIRNSEGELIGYAKITRDITEKRDAQLSLDMAREQLLQAQKMEAIGQLTGGVAHDFNNLLTAILSSLEMVRKHLPDDQRITRLIDNAEQGARRGATLTQRLLAYARRQPLEVGPVDLTSLVSELVGLIVPSLGTSISLETRFDGTGLVAVTDSNQLETALLNLCINARDAMPQGGRIEISARRDQLDESNPEGLVAGDYVCLAVRDEGEGMDAETLSRAAEPFFTTKGIGKGSGLGLPMVHGLAAQSGGRLILKSQKGQGTSAELWLPASDGVPGEAPGRNEPAIDSTAKLRILAVDDDALVLMNTAMMLEDLGHDVLPVHSGREAIEALEADGGFDLVLSDHAMPGMTGSQLASVIRSRWQDLPVLLVTGYAELPQDVVLPRLGKPFSQRELAKAVGDTVRRRAMA